MSAHINLRRKPTPCYDHNCPRQVHYDTLEEAAQAAKAGRTETSTRSGGDTHSERAQTAADGLAILARTGLVRMFTSESYDGDALGIMVIMHEQVNVRTAVKLTGLGWHAKQDAAGTWAWKFRY